MEGHDDWRVRNIEEQAPRLDLSIAHLEGNIDDSRWGRDLWMILCLIKAAKRAYTHLRSGRLDDSSHVAWACRNLLEIRIFSKYVSLSAENRKRFMNDMTVDTVQTNDAIIRMMELVRPGCPDSQDEIERLKQTSEALQQESGYNGTSDTNPPNAGTSGTRTPSSIAGSPTSPGSVGNGSPAGSNPMGAAATGASDVGTSGTDDSSH